MATKETTKTGNSNVAQSSTSTSSINAVPRQQANIQQVKNVLLIWLDGHIVENSSDCQNTMAQLRRVVNNTIPFSDGDQCIRCIEQTDNKKVCMIISGSLGQYVVPQVHNMSQVESIFIFCGNKEYHEQWAKEWPKIKGVFTNIGLICEALKRASKDCEQDAFSISFVATGDGVLNKSLNEIDPTLMYTEIMKKIFFTIQFNPHHRQQFIEYCRIQFGGNTSEMKVIKDLETNYASKTPIWWYKNECFLSSMLNTALLNMDGDVMIKMSFFINDLHRQIKQIHLDQFTGYPVGKTFTVFRGQGLPKANFEQLKKAQGGLISFNNFLSTSKKSSISMEFANNALSNSDSVGILFVMTIDPARSTAHFAAINELGYCKDLEDEVLFSMHSVFRINSIQQMGENARLFQVNLTLTSDNDEDLRKLTARIQEDTCPEEAGWLRIGCVLLKMGQSKKAEELFEDLLKQPAEESKKGTMYRFLGWIKYDQGKYQEALKLYERSIEIYTKTLPPNHPDLAKSYGNVGVVYYNMGNYSKALSSYRNALVTQQKSLPATHLDIAKSYNNIGAVYEDMLDYRKAQSNYERAVDIGKQSLPSNHPNLQQWTTNCDRVKKQTANRFYMSSE